MADQASFPADGTWFDTLKKSFVDVPVDTSNNNAIPTADFLEAAESLTTLFESPRPSPLLPFRLLNDPIPSPHRARPEKAQRYRRSAMASPVPSSPCPLLSSTN
ncbi:MAG: hypothetical protein Q9211_006735 [Gyalolechia sp. 1 TL-2023]